MNFQRHVGAEALRQTRGDAICAFAEPQSRADT